MQQQQQAGRREADERVDLRRLTDDAPPLRYSLALRAPASQTQKSSAPMRQASSQRWWPLPTASAGAVPEAQSSHRAVAFRIPAAALRRGSAVPWKGARLLRLISTATAWIVRAIIISPAKIPSGSAQMSPSRAILRPAVPNFSLLVSLPRASTCVMLSGLPRASSAKHPLPSSWSVPSFSQLWPRGAARIATDLLSCCWLSVGS